MAEWHAVAFIESGMCAGTFFVSLWIRVWFLLKPFRMHTTNVIRCANGDVFNSECRLATFANAHNGVRTHFDNHAPHVYSILHTRDGDKIAGCRSISSVNTYLRITQRASCERNWVVVEPSKLVCRCVGWECAANGFCVVVGRVADSSHMLFSVVHQSRSWLAHVGE